MWQMMGWNLQKQRLMHGARFIAAETADNVEVAAENRVGLHGCRHVITEDIEFTDDETANAISPVEVVIGCVWLTHTFGSTIET